jgi:hypothetical protein
MSEQMKEDYVSHARTPEELRSEVLSDLRRRLISLDKYFNTVARSGAEKARLSRAMEELVDMLNYWANLKIERPLTKREQERQRKSLTGEGISGRETLPHMPIASRPTDRRN